MCNLVKLLKSFSEDYWCCAVYDAFWKKVPVSNCPWIITVSVVLSARLKYVRVVREGVFGASWCV